MEGHVPRICLPQGDPQQYTATTYTEAMHCQGVFHPCLTTEGSWIHLGEGRRTSRQLAEASTP